MTNDYTKIPIQFDPTQQRMAGTTRHGRMAFDVPFISAIEGNLYVGGCQDGLILPQYIEHVISLYPWESYTVRHELRSSNSFKAYDDDVSLLKDRLKEIVDLAWSCVEKGPTLIHCQAGLNRSGLVAALVLMKSGRSAEDSIALLRRQRSPAVLCNPSFENWLLKENHDVEG